jgi:hypothetical protein
MTHTIIGEPRKYSLVSRNRSAADDEKVKIFERHYLAYRPNVTVIKEYKQAVIEKVEVKGNKPAPEVLGVGDLFFSVDILD